MTATADAPAVPEPTGAHHLNGDLATPPAARVVDPELPQPGKEDDLSTAGRLADYALAKLHRYVDGSDVVSSHFIELAIRLGELYARLGGTQPVPVQEQQVSKAEAPPAAAAAEPSEPFGLEAAEAAVNEQLAVVEAGLAAGG
jgi:hypothetical protein